MGASIILNGTKTASAAAVFALSEGFVINLPVGAPHPHKADAQRLLERCATEGRRLVTDAEVLQEILHRYVAIGRLDAIEPAFTVLSAVVDEILAIDAPTMLLAKSIVLGGVKISARDAVHAAVMKRHGITDILTFGRGFDDIPGVRRLA